MRLIDYKKWYQQFGLEISSMRISYKDAQLYAGSRVTLRSCINEFVEVLLCYSFKNFIEEVMDFIYCTSLFLYQNGIRIGYFPKTAYYKYKMRVDTLKHIFNLLDLDFKLDYCSKGTNIAKISKLRQIVDRGIYDRDRRINERS